MSPVQSPVLTSHTRTPALQKDCACFTWMGSEQPCLFGDFNAWDPATAIRLEPVGAGCWQITLPFPEDAYIEYAYLIGEKRCLDPLNPHSIANGTGERNNYFYMPAAYPNPFTRKNRRIPAGRVSSHTVKGDERLANRRRTVYLYEPAAEGPFPLLVVFDGRDYLRRAHITTILDHLIHRGRIQPIAMALVDNAGPGRFIEYACNDGTVSFVANRILPLASSELPLLNPGGYGLLGASMGGVMALYTAVRAPELFGKALCQAGAFSMYGEDFSVFDHVAWTVPSQVKVWMNIGCFDFLLEANRKMHRLLLGRGFSVTYQEHHGGHNYTTWRNHLAEGLIASFPKESGVPGDDEI